jgi:hypothetical protein
MEEMPEGTMNTSTKDQMQTGVVIRRQEDTSECSYWRGTDDSRQFAGVDAGTLQEYP